MFNSMFESLDQFTYNLLTYGSLWIGLLFFVVSVVVHDKLSGRQFFLLFMVGLVLILSSFIVQKRSTKCYQWGVDNHTYVWFESHTGKCFIRDMRYKHVVLSREVDL